MKRIVLAGLLAGIAVFVFSAIIHMALPIGHMGLKSLPSEDAVLAAMRAGITEPGLYFFPGMDMDKKMTAEEQKAWTDRYVAGPTGLLVYHPGGEAPMLPRQLVVELLADVLAAALAAFVIGHTTASFGRRVLVVALFGVFAWLSVDVSFWNWYRFPTPWAVAELIDQAGGWFAGGLVIAAIYRSK